MDGGAIPGSQRPARARTRAGGVRADGDPARAGARLSLPTGTRLALVVLAAAAGIAALRALLVPVGSFRDGLASLEWGMPADSVIAVLGDPNRICASGDVDHVPVAAPDSAHVRRALRASTAERWIYTRRGGRRPVPRDAGPGCRAPSIATELGLDADRRLRWYVREMDQTALELDPAALAGATSRR